MTATHLVVTAVTTRSLRAVLAAPFSGWLASWHAFSYGNTAAAFVLAAPVAVPAGLLIASWAWQVRIYRIETCLLDRLPQVTGILHHAPADLQQDLYRSFRAQMIYNHQDNQVSCYATTITPTPPKPPPPS